jgi:porphobilinogen synthase
MLTIRPRRNRKSDAIRRLVEESFLRPADFVAPFFVVEGQRKRVKIPSFPGVDQLSIDLILKEAERLHSKGILSIALFPVIDPSMKDAEGSQALDPNGIIPRALQLLKKEIPSLCLITDVALDPYTSHGHDGVIDQNGRVLNDESVKVLTKSALIAAEAGADFVAPSDMMDGRVGAIRLGLDQAGLEEVGIISYTAKYASSLYAPFRDLLGSKLKFGDKKTYQMNPANSREAVRQAMLDIEQGADMVMVKPALFYLDVIAQLRAKVHVPICTYHVSGEYSMVMAAHAAGWLDASKVFYEALLSMKRAGADFIFTYAIDHVLPQIQSL